MSKCRLAQALVLGALLAATNLAGMTAIAHAQATNEGKDARRPPDQRPGATGRAGRAARLAHRLARVPGRSPGPGGRPRRTRRHPAQPQTPTPSRAGALSTVTVTPLDGAAAPTRQPHHPCRQPWHRDVRRSGWAIRTQPGPVPNAS
jgi:hypothetical protein